MTPSPTSIGPDCDDSAECRYSRCERSAEIEIRFIDTGEEKIYCLEHADGALSEYAAARLGAQVETDADQEASR